jgi:hypothetical protein
MADLVREEFATQISADTLTALRELAHSEGRQVESLVEEALADLLEKRRHNAARPHVMAAYLSSIDKYDELYKKLAE